jgi:hypothetical protein
MYQQLRVKWGAIVHLMDFANYFDTQWIEETFNNWQLYRRGAGIPGIYSIILGTNNSLEGFNNIIKNFIGKSKKYQMIPLMSSN